MKINIVGEVSTDQKIIEALAETIPKLFPLEANLELVDSGERYMPERENVLNWSDPIYGDKINVYGGITDPTGKFWMSLEPIICRYKPCIKDEYLMIIGHRDFISMDMGTLLLAGLAGDRMLATRQIENGNYHGMADYRDRWVFLGLPNDDCIGAVKVGAHEIAHLFLDRIPFWEGSSLEDHLNGKIPNHCKNYASDKRCLMNPSHPVTQETIQEITLNFCEFHTKRLTEIIRNSK